MAGMQQLPGRNWQTMRRPGPDCGPEAEGGAGTGDVNTGTGASREKFARLRDARRVWAISAIHGEARRLARVHDLIGERFYRGDRLVYLGNYLGHGDDVRATLDELLDFRRRV